MKTPIVSPLLTEKATAHSQKGIYTFQVMPGVTKQAVQSFLQELYGVEISAVRMATRKGKVRRVGKKMAAKSEANRRIAYVTVSKGSIPLFPKT